MLSGLSASAAAPVQQLLMPAIPMEIALSPSAVFIQVLYLNLTHCMLLNTSHLLVYLLLTHSASAIFHSTHHLGYDAMSKQ